MEQVLQEGVVLEPEEVWEEKVVEEGCREPDQVLGPAVSVYVHPVELLLLTRQEFPCYQIECPKCGTSMVRK